MFKLNNIAINQIQYPDLEITEGGTTFVKGESGTGKSTLLKLLNGVKSPETGQILYQGQNLESYDAIALRKEILLVSQAAFLFDQQTILENFQTYFEYRGLKAPSPETAAYFLELCSLNLPLDTCAYNLSGGEKQRAFIAINLALDPKIIMLDEPTSALDEKNGTALLSNIKTYCEENAKTLLVVSHDFSLVERFADKVVDLGGAS